MQTVTAIIFIFILLLQKLEDNYVASTGIFESASEADDHGVTRYWLDTTVRHILPRN